MLSPDRLPRWMRAGLAAVVLLRPAAAGADVVMPPPAHCPRGTVAETSHRGPECVKEAPKDCPRGWRGQMGGTCTLTPCTGDDGCAKGEACVEHSACLESFVDLFYDYTEDPGEGRAQPSPPPGLLAAPPPERRRRSSPVTRFNAVNLCADGVKCGAPRQCLPEKICVPKGTRGLPYLGTNVTPARVARKLETPAAPAPSTPPSAPAPSASDASAPAPPVDPSPAAPSPGTPPSGTAPVSGGCAGCATADSSAPLFGLPLLGLAVLLVARRRRRG